MSDDYFLYPKESSLSFKRFLTDCCMDVPYCCKMQGGSEKATVRVPTLLLADVEEEEFEWITDSDGDDPEFECDSCGRVIDESADRFHCETCGDYDLVRASSRATIHRFCLMWAHKSVRLFVCLFV